MLCDRANNGDGVQWEQAANERRVASGENRVGLAYDFVAAGIDDLAKYQILHLLYQYPTAAGAAAYFAAYLGFHSIELTAVLLEELAGLGMLVKEAAHGAAEECYRLVDDDEMRRQLDRLYNSTSQPLVEASVLRVLANRSLLKARARAKPGRNGNGGGHGKTRPTAWLPSKHPLIGEDSAGDLPVNGTESKTRH